LLLGLFFTVFLGVFLLLLIGAVALPPEIALISGRILLIRSRFATNSIASSVFL
jgi:hypothetical protein